MNIKEILNKTRTKKTNYPILAWIEDDNRSNIVLITNEGEYKLISKINGPDLVTLYKSIQDILKIKDIRTQALEGDNHILIDKLIDNEELSWDYLINETNRLLNEYKNKNEKDIAKEINKELFNNYINDLSVSILENIYKSIIYILLSKGSTIGITELMIVGNIVYDKGLSRVLQMELPEEYNITLLDL